jgi:hypothetical protein
MTETLARDTLVLSRHDVRRLMSMDECIDAVENAFRDHALGRSISPGILGSHVPGGGFHVKTAGLVTDRQSVFVAKVNAKLPRQPVAIWPADDSRRHRHVRRDQRQAARHSRLHRDHEYPHGRRKRRRGAPSRSRGRRDRHGMRMRRAGQESDPSPDARAADQAGARVRYGFREGRACAQELSDELDIAVTPVRELGTETRRSDIWVTCTTSRRVVRRRDHVRSRLAGVGGWRGQRGEAGNRAGAASRKAPW